MLLAAIIAGWIACGVAHYGFWVAHFQGAFPLIADEFRREDRVLGVIGAVLLGPIALLTTLICGFYRYGWRL